jgi:nitrogen fixation protein NifZ
MTAYQTGDMVFAAIDLYNDPVEESGASGIPGLLPGMLLVTAGTRGVIVRIGHPEAVPEATICLVSFETGPDGSLGDAIGCLAEELSYQAPG